MTADKTQEECNKICELNTNVRCLYGSCIFNCLSAQCKENCTGNNNSDSLTHCENYCADQKYCNCDVNDLIKQYIGNDPLKEQYVHNKFNYINLTKD